MSESAETGQPGPSTRKNRKINRSAGQLKRNAACVPCRKRRVKCDGTRPTCATCTRSFHFLARTQPDAERDAIGVQCWYEDGEDEDHSEHPHDSHGHPALASAASHGRKRKAAEALNTDPDPDPDPGLKIQQLEMKIAELQNALFAATNANASRSSSVQLPAQRPKGPGSSTSVRSEQCPPPYGPVPTDHSNTATPDYSWPPTQHLAPLPAPLVTIPPPIPSQPLRPDNMNDQAGFERMDAEAGQISGPFLDVFWPGWPKRLPTPTMMDHLVFTFFNSLPGAARLIHRQSFQARLALPPRHADFPHPALLHAICAAAARYTAAVKVTSISQLIDKSLSNPPAELAPGQSTMDEEASSEPCFSERHWKYSVLELRYDNCQGTKLLDLLQAQVVLYQYFCQTGKWLDGWILSGRMISMAIALGLMYDPDSSNTDPVRKTGMLPPAKHDWQREERRAIMSTVLITDMHYSAAGNWPGTLPPCDDIQFRLPASMTDCGGNGPIPENPQHIHSADLFMYHPVEDGFVMYVKGSILTGRVSMYCRKVRRMPPAQRALSRQSPAFLSLDQDLRDLSQTFPMSLSDPVQYRYGYSNRLDADLVNAHLVHRNASILLHLPFADVSNPGCPSAGRVLAESRGCLGVLYRVMSTTTDMALSLHPITSLWLYHPARALLMYYHRALEVGDNVSADSLLSEIEVFQMALAAMGNRFAMGALHCGMIDTMVRRIQEEFGVPPQNWRWSPHAWSGGLQDSSALNFRAGMRSHDPHLPMLPKTHPEGAAWAADGKDRRSYREIIDEQRAFAGPPHRGAKARPAADLTNLAEMAGVVAVPSQPTVAPGTMPVPPITMGPVPHMYDTYSYAGMAMQILASVDSRDGARALDSRGQQMGAQGARGRSGQGRS